MASGTKSVTVLAVKLQNFTVTPAAPWTAGQTVTLKVQSVQDSTPRVGKSIYFYATTQAGTSTYFSATTGSDGYATATYTIPWVIDGGTVPCTTLRFDAQDLEAGAWSTSISGKVAYPTRISISAPDSVGPNVNFTVSGKLEYQNSPTTWAGLAGRTVSLYYNGNKIGDVATGSDGSYSKSDCKIPTSGTYTLKAVYAGEGLTAAAAAVLGLTVSPETKTALSITLPIIAGAIVALTSLKAKR
jgi:hypothetical protein